MEDDDNETELRETIGEVIIIINDYYVCIKY